MNKAAVSSEMAAFLQKGRTCVIQIRMAGTADVAGILDIYRPYIENTAITFEYDVPSEADFLQRFRDITSRGPWLVAEEAGQLLGYAYLDRAFVRAAYAWAADLSVYLRPEARGRGLGRAFYTLLERMAALQGYQVLYGLVTTDNDASCRFHEAMGYRLLCCMPDCGFKLGRWHGVNWYEKRLCPPTAPAAMPTPAPEMDWSSVDGSGLEQWEVCL